MKRITYEIDVKTGPAEDSLKSVESELSEINKGLKTTEDGFQDINKDAESLNKTLGKTGNAAKGARKGFRAMGVALKAVGIGLLIKGLAIVGDLLSTNQKVVDGFKTAINAITIAFNDFFNYISDNIEVVTGFFKKLFEDPVANIKKFGTAIKDELLNRFKQFAETLGFLGKALSELFAGNFQKAFELAKKAAVEAVDIVTGGEDGLKKIKNVLTGASESVTQYAVDTYNAASANVELAKSAEIAAVQNQGLIEKYDLQAETLRQVRDEERNSIAERRKANDDLAAVLDEQEKVMLKNAQIAIKLANKQLALDKDNVEAQVAKIEAENELAAIRAQVAGFRSEQQANDLALSREEIEMTNSKSEAESRLSFERKKFDAEQLDTDEARIERLKEINAEELQVEGDRLQNIINSANAGTQAKIDAEIAYKEFLEQMRQEEILLDKELADAKVEINKKANDQQLLDDKEAGDLEKERAQYIADAKESIQANTLNAISSLITVFNNQSEENAKRTFNLQKGLAIVETLINTSAAIMKTAKETTDFTPPQAIRVANMVAMGVAGAAQVAAIASQKFNPSGGGGGGTAPTPTGGGGAPSQPPSFNVVGASGFNQIAGALGQQGPVQAFVVGSQVTTQQQLDNNIVATATF
mgnify:CR=1 FL=1